MISTSSVLLVTPCMPCSYATRVGGKYISIRRKGLLTHLHLTGAHKVGVPGLQLLLGWPRPLARHVVSAGMLHLRARLLLVL